MAASTRILPESIFNPKLYTRVLSLWFGDLPATATAPDESAGNRWFGMGGKDAKDAFDGECTQVCTDALRALSPDQWPLPTFESFEADRQIAPLISAPFRSAVERDSSRGPEGLAKVDVALSLALLLDQMPRNIFRDAAGQRLVYSHYDRLSRSLISSIINGSASSGDSDVKDLDLDPKYRLNLARRIWFYLPLMHSEDLVYHDEFSARLKGFHDDISKTGDEEAKEYAQTTIDFEQKHRTLLERFGRYPHRNEALGRIPTLEETKFLTEGGETFGTG